MDPSKLAVRRCPMCLQHSRSGSLHEYHVNFEESVLLCDHDECPYITEKGDINDQDDDLTTILNNLPPVIDDSTSSCDLSMITTLSEVAPNSSPLGCVEEQYEAKELPVQTDLSTLAIDNSLTTEQSFSDGLYVMLWGNIDALCWLDVLLCYVCHNMSIRNIAANLPYSSVLKKLLLTFDEAQAMIEPLQQGQNKLLCSVMGMERGLVKRGGGFCTEAISGPFMTAAPSSSVFSSKDIDSARRKLHLACIKMECAREEVWQNIEPLLRCRRGKDDSPVFAFPIILNLEQTVKRLFDIEYCWEMTCSSCFSKQQSHHTSSILTIPKIPTKLHSGNIFYKTNCIACSCPNQTRSLSITRYAPNIVMHFAEGLPSADIDGLMFKSSSGQTYVVCAVIEYKISPNHFTLWQRKASLKNEGDWMVYDDLKSQYAQFSTRSFTVPAKNIHMVFWESIHTPDAELVPSSLKINEGKCDQAHQSDTQITTQDQHIPPNSRKSKIHETAKPVKLLKGKIEKKVSNGSSSLVSSSSQSHSQVVKLLNQHTELQPRVPNQSSQSIVNTSRSSLPPKRPNRSYLDMVKPLLEKNRQKKSLTGYVPMSKRSVSESTEHQTTDVKKKKVMFTEDSVKQSRRNTSVRSKLISPANEVRESPHVSTTDTSDNPSTAPELQNSNSDIANGPSLDDVLADLGLQLPI